MSAGYVLEVGRVAMCKNELGTEAAPRKAADTPQGFRLARVFRSTLNCWMRLSRVQ